MKTLFDICTPREDILSGSMRESDFAADLAEVIAGDSGPVEYSDPAIFFANTYPTEGLKALLSNVCRRLTSAGGEAASLYRLDTQYGGGKTHALIALLHAARGMKGVTNASEFIDESLIPSGDTRVAAFDGENADPVNGRPMGDGIRAYTPWGELAYSLAGVDGYREVEKSDLEKVAPGADTLKRLFSSSGTLILLDELSVYLRKVRGRKEEAQLTPFLTGLFKAVESKPGTSLVFTLAVGKSGKATDAYSLENEFLAGKMEEAASVSARKATLIDPTTEGETAKVLRRRLFASVDEGSAAAVVEQYGRLWGEHREELPTQRVDEDWIEDFASSYPFHPGLLSLMTDKLSTLSDFQRVRGMLRLLTRTVADLWDTQPDQTYAVHLHHMNPAYGPIHNEIVTRLGLKGFDPAIRNDVATAEGTVSLAQDMDLRHYKGLAPYASFAARNALWHTFAHNEPLKGITSDELRFSVLAPDLDVSFIDDGRTRFAADSAYLDDRPGAPMRFQTEANLTQMIRRQMKLVDKDEARAQLKDRIRDVFSGTDLNLLLFPGGQHEVDDDVGDGRPKLVVVSYDAETVRADEVQIPAFVAQLYRFHGTKKNFRKFVNNLVFLVADEQHADQMKGRMVRRIALEALRAPDRRVQLSEHQQDKLDEYYRKSEGELAVAIQQTYRHLFYPSRQARIDGATINLAHAAFDVPSASEKPGAGQVQVVRTLKDANKLLRPEDAPPAPAYIRDQTPLKKGQQVTADLRAEFRKDAKLPILLGDDVFLKLVRKGIEEGLYVYKRGDLLLGPTDPFANIIIDSVGTVYTMAFAKSKDIWPRKAVLVDPPPPPPPDPPDPDPDPEPPVVRGELHQEGPLREALTRLWEDAKGQEVEVLSGLAMRFFTVSGFRLLPVLGGLSGPTKRIVVTASYETSDGATLQLEYDGGVDDAKPLKEFLDAQFRGAASTALHVHYFLEFPDGLDLTGEDPKSLEEKMTRFVTETADVTAEVKG